MLEVWSTQSFEEKIHRQVWELQHAAVSCSGFGSPATYWACRLLLDVSKHGKHKKGPNPWHTVCREWENLTNRQLRGEGFSLSCLPVFSGCRAGRGSHRQPPLGVRTPGTMPAPQESRRKEDAVPQAPPREHLCRCLSLLCQRVFAPTNSRTKGIQDFSFHSYSGQPPAHGWACRHGRDEKMGMLLPQVVDALVLNTPQPRLAEGKPERCPREAQEWKRKAQGCLLCMAWGGRCTSENWHFGCRFLRNREVTYQYLHLLLDAVPTFHIKVIFCPDQIHQKQIETWLFHKFQLQLPGASLYVPEDPVAPTFIKSLHT